MCVVCTFEVASSRFDNRTSTWYIVIILSPHELGLPVVGKAFPDDRMNAVFNLVASLNCPSSLASQLDKFNFLGLTSPFPPLCKAPDGEILGVSWRNLRFDTSDILPGQIFAPGHRKLGEVLFVCVQTTQCGGVSFFSTSQEITCWGTSSFLDRVLAWSADLKNQNWQSCLRNTDNAEKCLRKGITMTNTSTLSSGNHMSFRCLLSEQVVKKLKVGLFGLDWVTTVNCTIFSLNPPQLAWKVGTTKLPNYQIRLNIDSARHHSVNIIPLEKKNTPPFQKKPVFEFFRAI